MCSSLPPGKAQQAFWIGQTPVTVAAYRRFARETRRDLPGGQRGDDHPVVNGLVARRPWPTASGLAAAAQEQNGNTPRWPVPQRSLWPSGRSGLYGDNSRDRTHRWRRKPNAWGPL